MELRQWVAQLQTTVPVVGEGLSEKTHAGMTLVKKLAVIPFVVLLVVLLIFKLIV